MAKAQSKSGMGQGWHKQSIRHSIARRTGHAGGKYSDSRAKWYSTRTEYHDIGHPKMKDSDGDGVPDVADCAPHDPHKQHTITRIRTADGTTASDLSGEIQKSLREKGYDASIEVKNSSRIDVKQVRLSDKGIEEMGYNVKEAEYTKSGQRRSRVPTWEQWEDINHTINDVLDKHKTFANIQSLGGKFKIRKGTERVDEWEEQKHENVGSIMNPVERVDLYTQER